MLDPISFLPFLDEASRLDFLKQFGFTQKALKENEFVYKGFYTDKPIVVKIVGHIETGSVVIETPTGLHTINGFHLKDMQKKDFDLKKTLIPEAKNEAPEISKP